MTCLRVVLENQRISTETVDSQTDVDARFGMKFHVYAEMPTIAALVK